MATFVALPMIHSAVKWLHERESSSRSIIVLATDVARASSLMSPSEGRKSD